MKWMILLCTVLATTLSMMQGVESCNCEMIPPGACEGVNEVECPEHFEPQRCDCCRSCMVKPTTAEPTTIAPTQPPKGFEAYGCYKDVIRDRALPELVENFRSMIDWNDLTKVVKMCSEVTKAKGYQCFGVQFYGECWSGPKACETFWRHGESNSCWRGVGRGHANFIYVNN